ncbi:hypothetical protein Avbf_11510 [Armadillidium vulgare]|nr:hypothetical protein Avbf_11510 [Armadillidium vulgare]
MIVYRIKRFKVGENLALFRTLNRDKVSRIDFLRIMKNWYEREVSHFVITGIGSKKVPNSIGLEPLVQNALMRLNIVENYSLYLIVKIFYVCSTYQIYSPANLNLKQMIFDVMSQLKHNIESHVLESCLSRFLISSTISSFFTVTSSLVSVTRIFITPSFISLSPTRITNGIWFSSAY